VATTTQSPSYSSAPPSMWDSLKKGVEESRLPWLFILPSVLVMFIITFIPQAYQIVISFQDFQAQNLRDGFAPWIGIENFASILNGELGQRVPNYNFLPLLGFNIVWTVVNVFFHAGIGLAVAVALNGQHVLFRPFYRAIFVLPWALPGYITALIWNNLWQEQSGGFNLLLEGINETVGTSFPTNTAWLTTLDRPIDLRSILPFVVIIGTALIAFWLVRRTMRLGLRDEKTGKLNVERTVFSIGGIILCVLACLGTLLDLVTGNIQNSSANLFFQRAGAPVMAFYAVMIANIWLGWPFMMVVATGALSSISPDMYEAADVDGANRWTQFWSLTIPMIRPAMIPAIMLGTIWTFNQFNVIFFITGGGPRSETDLLVTQAYKLIAQDQLYGAASAFALIVFVILLIITLIQNRITRATEAAA
jgi:ABC-type sugar transport system permease subunit